MQPSSNKQRNLRRCNTRAARTHLIYTTNEVLELYGISSSTLTSWIKLGLPHVRGTVNLFRGQDLNAFQRWFRQKNRRTLGLMDVLCVHCKEAHSALDNTYRILSDKTKCTHLVVRCPASGNEAYKIIASSDIDLINETHNHKNRDDQGHYTEARLRSKTAIFSLPETAQINPENLRMGFEYQTYLKQVSGYDGKTIIGALRHIAEFDEFTGHRDYKSVQRDNAISFKEIQEAKIFVANDESRSASTIVHRLLSMKSFFNWLNNQARHNSNVPDVGDYFSPSKRVISLAGVSVDKFIPTLDDVRRLILAMPSDNIIQRRDRALIAFLLLTGVRISALLSLRLQHINVAECRINQDAREVQTKNAKTMITAWFDVGEDIAVIFKDWVTEYRQLGANDSSPLFPRAPDPIRFRYGKTYDAPLVDEGTVRKILKNACALIGLPYFNPHSIRNTLALLGDELCQTHKQRKAWSQNLGHESIKTTENYYAKLDQKEQLSTMDEIRLNSAPTDTRELIHIAPQLSPKALNILLGMAKALIEK